MNENVIREYLDIEDQVKEAKSKLKLLQEQMDEAEEDLRGEFEKSGVDSVNMNGRNVRLQRSLWASKRELTERKDQCEALKKAGYEDYVYETYHSSSVSALFRDLESEAESIGIPFKKDTAEFLPEELKDSFDVNVKYDIRTRKAAKKKR